MFLVSGDCSVCTCPGTVERNQLIARSGINRVFLRLALKNLIEIYARCLVVSLWAKTLAVVTEPFCTHRAQGVAVDISTTPIPR